MIEAAQKKTKPLPEWKAWLNFRDNYLDQKEKELGSLSCTYCSRTVRNDKTQKEDSVTIDHIVPLSKGGGKFDLSNLAISCLTCNREKKDMTVETWEAVKKNESPTPNVFCDLGTIFSSNKYQEDCLVNNSCHQAPGSLVVFKKERIFIHHFHRMTDKDKELVISFIKKTIPFIGEPIHKKRTGHVRKYGDSFIIGLDRWVKGKRVYLSFEQEVLVAKPIKEIGNQFKR